MIDTGTVIAIILSLLAVGGALAYIITARLRGQKCIGCPYAKQCGKRECNCHTGHGSETEKRP